MSLSISDQLIYSTILIQGKTRNGKLTTGTGFFYNISEDKQSPFIVTNKHVIEDLVTCGFYFSKIDKGASVPSLGNYVTLNIDNIQGNWILHPEADLAIFPFIPIYNYYAEQGINLYFKSFNNKLLPPENCINNILPAEDVLMVGYPNGLWDSKNNLPFFRKGAISTPYYANYKGKREFVIDIPVFPGSSGSPIILLNQGLYVTSDGETNIGGNRFFLLGILCAGHTYTSQGELKIVKLPELSIKPQLTMFLDLGICIKSSYLRDFADIILSKKSNI